MTGYPTARTARQRGFLLAQLLAMVTVMGIMLTVAMPSVIAETQRDKEAELIFRGESIRNAIRRFKAKTGGYPLNLEDLMKQRPRILRKLYTDPMVEDGDWELLTAVQAGAGGNAAGLPIVGVRSRSEKDSFRIYQGKTIYSEWLFSASDDLLGLSPRPEPPPPPN